MCLQKYSKRGVFILEKSKVDHERSIRTPLAVELDLYTHPRKGERKKSNCIELGQFDKLKLEMVAFHGK